MYVNLFFLHTNTTPSSFFEQFLENPSRISRGARRAAFLKCLCISFLKKIKKSSGV